MGGFSDWKGTRGELGDAGKVVSHLRAGHTGSSFCEDSLRSML